MNDAVVVRSTAVQRPAFARYGWTGFPFPPLQFSNLEGLPASPFEVPVLPVSAGTLSTDP